MRVPRIVLRTSSIRLFDEQRDGYSVISFVQSNFCSATSLQRKIFAMLERSLEGTFEIGEEGYFVGILLMTLKLFDLLCENYSLYLNFE